MAHRITSTEAAEQLIQDIRKKKGYVQQSSMAQIPDHVRKEVEEALLMKDEMIGATVLTLAKNLYTSKARFVFELLQNADDNHYGRLETDDVPFVSFKLRDTRVQNLPRKHTLEKGIGFKSVFMAAWKVHIRSGYLAFSFVHRKGESGMGMVQPNWESLEEEEEQEAPSNTGDFCSTTRITLFLHENDSTIADVRQQLEQLQSKLLLFLRNIRRIGITIIDDDDEVEVSKVHSLSDSSRNRVWLQTSSSIRGTPQPPIEQLHHVTKFLANNLQRYANRTLTESEVANKSYARSEIVLSFPLTNEFIPIVEPQQVFAFLPIRQVGFNFLIHADFETQANREDVVITSPRNLSLVPAIASAFIQALEESCAYNLMKYAWPRLLPREDQHSFDPFWKKLVSEIRERFKTTPLLLTDGASQRRCVNEVYILTKDCQDETGNPLFEDLPRRVYLSRKYKSIDIDALRNYGLTNFDLSIFIELVRHDLDSKSSRYRQTMTTDWHARVATQLCKAFVNTNRVKIIAVDILNLGLVPISNGTWVSQKNLAKTQCFFGVFNSVKVPEGFSSNHVLYEAEENPSRKKLFTHLGVKDLSLSRAYSHISSTLNKGTTLRRSIGHLHFIYTAFNEELIKEQDPLVLPMLRGLLLFDTEFKARRVLDAYMPSEHIYSASQLLGKEGINSVGGMLLSLDYFESSPKAPAGWNLTLKEWMQKYMGTRIQIPLIAGDGKSLSRECHYVAEHRKDRLLGYLQSTWEESESQITSSQPLIEELSRLIVPGWHAEKQYPIGQSFVPIQSLVDTVERLLGDYQSEFSFMDIPGLGTDGNTRRQALHHIGPWAFLNKLGAGSKANLDFRLAILRHYQRHYRYVESVKPTLLAENYCYIYALILGSNVPDLVRGQIRKAFEEKRLICYLDPTAEAGDKLSCCLSSECLWDAPVSMKTKSALKPLYEAMFSENQQTDFDTLRNFLQKTLQIKDASWQDIVAELEYWRGDTGQGEASADPGMAHIRSCYRYLDDGTKGRPELRAQVLAAFTDHALVYVPTNQGFSWCRLSDCLWIESTSIDQKFAIRSHYEELESFFVDFLRVPTVSFKMIHDELLAETNGKRTRELQPIKGRLRQLNDFLRGMCPVPDSSKLMKAKCLPIRTADNVVLFGSASMDFLINDRQELHQVFSSQVRFLDFSLDEVCRLGPLINWLGLSAKYASKSVEEVSRVLDRSDETCNSNRSHTMLHIAHGLVRVTNMFKGLKDDDQNQLYQRLEQSRLIETSGISSRLEVTQDGVVYSEEVSQSDLHFEQVENGGLNIYVPQDKAKREMCFHSALPRRLFSWLMRSSQGSGSLGTAGVDIERGVFLTSCVINLKPSMLAELLSKEGVPLIDLPEPEDESAEAGDALLLGTDRAESVSTSQIPYDPALPDERLRMDSWLEARSSMRQSSARSQGLITVTLPEDGSVALEPSRPLSPPPVLSDTSRSEEYLRLLEGAVRAARATRVLRSTDLDVSSAIARLSLEPGGGAFFHGSRMSFSGSWEDNCLIGAAGELYVFELLSQVLQAESFNYANWPSNIRHLVALHPDHSNIQRFGLAETSDIVYNDIDGTLTSKLLDSGMLNDESWRGKMPKYYIEVKTTTNSPGAPFYMSGNQFTRMEKLHGARSMQENEIYAVFRVFNLGQQSMDVGVYVDPERHRREGTLSFSVDSRATFTVSALD